MNLYELHNLSFRRSARFTLEIDRFTLLDREKLAVVGPNGSGKTTLLRLLAFLETPTSWERYTFRGHSFYPGKMDRTGLGVVQQSPYLFGGSVAQNLAYPLKLRKMARPTRDERIRAMLELIDLTPLADAAARKLSGGEQKRLALGRVLIAEPELLLLDEPTAHLDRPSRRVIERVLTRTNISLLLVTHDLHLAHRVADRVLNLQAGRICPSLPENILEGRVEQGDLVTTGGLRIHLPSLEANTGEPLADGDTLTVMIDPRSLVLSLEPLSSSMRNQFTGQVSSIREHGGGVWLEIDCADRLTVIISRESYAKLGINLNLELVVSCKANAVEIL